MKIKKAVAVLVVPAAFCLGIVWGSIPNQSGQSVAQDIQKPGHGAVAQDIQKPGHGPVVVAVISSSSSLFGIDSASQSENERKAA